MVIYLYSHKKAGVGKHWVDTGYLEEQDVTIKLD